MTDPTPLPSVKDYVIDVAERAVRTFFQTLAAYFGAGALDLLHADWAHALDLSAGAAALSIITSMAAAPFGEGGTASLTKAIVPRALVERLRGRHAVKASGGFVGPLGETVTPRLRDDYIISRADVGQLGARFLDSLNGPRVTRRHLTEQVVEGHRLGRHVHHDPRSLAYLVPETDTPVTVMWTRRVPVFDQGNLGSCTGNAAAGVLGTDPFYATLPAGLIDDEKEAVSLYSAATRLDDYTGTYPPDDTGSDGLSVAKACQRAGLIAGYQHITSVAAAQTAIKSGPFIVGVNWYSSMDNPDAHGLVKVNGQIRGGHEFECHGYDAQADLWWFTNSWGASWGLDGTFCMSSASFARLLSEQGDATVFLPIAAPAPPEPPPAPPSPSGGFPLAAWEAFSEHPYSRPKERAAIAAVNAWLSGGGS